MIKKFLIALLFRLISGRHKDSLGDQERKISGYKAILDEDALYVIGQRLDRLERKMMYATGKSADFLRYRYYELLDMVESAKLVKKSK